MTLTETLDAFREFQRRQRAYEYAAGVLSYDAAAVAPRTYTATRGEGMALFAKHQIADLTSPHTLQMLDTLAAADLDEQTAREVAVLTDKAKRKCAVPLALWGEHERLVAESEAVWENAKRTNDFAAWAPHLQKVIDSTKELAARMYPDRAPYDGCLAEYEEGQSTETLDRFFSVLRSRLVPLIRAVADSPTVIRDDFLYRSYPVDAQRALTADLCALLKLDTDHCVIGESEHPFTADLCREDVRITTHYHPHDLTASLYSVIHEAGHAHYALGVSPLLDHSVLGGGMSMGLHESQSRFLENVIGRSRPFICALYPLLLSHFPSQLADVSEEDLWRAVNKVSPSLIRTEADEVTYSLHVLIRYELEKQLIGGTLAVEDLPAAWNALYRDVLGVTVPDDTHGVLQDSHWAGGAFGYFPSYALGSAYGAQLLAALNRACDIRPSIADGDLSPVLNWLKDRIWQHGNLYPPHDLIETVCGAPFSPQYYVDYLTQKCLDLYAL